MGWADLPLALEVRSGPGLALLRETLGITIPATIFGAAPPGCASAEHIRAAELSEHSPWADEFVLVAKVAAEFHWSLQVHELRMAEHDMHLWSTEPPKVADGG